MVEQQVLDDEVCLCGEWMLVRELPTQLISPEEAMKIDDDGLNCVQ